MSESQGSAPGVGAPGTGAFTEAPRPAQNNAEQQRAQTDSKDQRAKTETTQQRPEVARKAEQIKQAQGVQEEKKRQREQAKMDEELAELANKPITDEKTNDIGTNDKPPSSIAENTLKAIAEGRIPPPAPKIQRMIASRLQQNPGQYERVQREVQALIENGLYNYIATPKDLSRAMHLANIDESVIRQAYQVMFGEELPEGKIEDLPPDQVDTLAKAVIAFESVITTGSYIRQSEAYMTRVKERYISMYSYDGKLTKDQLANMFDQKLDGYTNAALKAFPLQEIAVTVFEQVQRQQQADENVETIVAQQPQQLEKVQESAQIEAIVLAEEIGTIVDSDILQNVEITPNHAINLDEIARGDYNEKDLAQAVLHKAEQESERVNQPTGVVVIRYQRQITGLQDTLNNLLPSIPQESPIYASIKAKLLGLGVLQRATEMARSQANRPVGSAV